MEKLFADFKEKLFFFVIVYEKYLGPKNDGGVAKVDQLLTAQVLAVRYHYSTIPIGFSQNQYCSKRGPLI